MRGLGTAAKQAIRAARHTWDEALILRRHPYEAFKWKALENTSLFPDYFFHVVPGLKLVYVEVPKTASSYILETIQKIALTGRSKPVNIHIRSESGFKSPRSIGILRFIQIIDDPQTFIFTSVRNPYSRIVSCYFDKFAKVLIGDGSYISNCYISYCRLKGKITTDGSSITFDEFVDFACNTAAFGIDGHWCRQSDIVPIAIAKPQFVIRFETLDDDLKHVIRRFSGATNYVTQPKSVAPATSGRLLKEVLSSKTATQVSNAYAIDFERFGYTSNLDEAN